MENDNNKTIQKEINIPEFAQRQFKRQTNFNRTYGQTQQQRTKDQSIHSQKVRAKKKKKKISLFQHAKRELAILGLGVSITLGATTIANADDIQAFFEQRAITHEVMTEYEEIVLKNKNLIPKNENGFNSLVLDNSGKPAYQFDTSSIGSAMKEKLKQGKSEEEVVYGIYATMVCIPDDVDDFYQAMRSAGLNDNENGWARNNGYEDMNDKYLSRDAKREMVKAANIAKYQSEIGTMLTGSESNVTTDKSIGGK